MFIITKVKGFLSDAKKEVIADFIAGVLSRLRKLSSKNNLQTVWLIPTSV